MLASCVLLDCARFRKGMVQALHRVELPTNILGLMEAESMKEI